VPDARSGVARAAPAQGPAGRALDRAFHTAANQLEQIRRGQDSDWPLTVDDGAAATPDLAALREIPSRNDAHHLAIREDQQVVNAMLLHRVSRFFQRRTGLDRLDVDMMSWRRMVVVLSKSGSHDTSAFLKTTQAMLGLEGLPCDSSPDTVPTMADLFTAPVGP
jgi:hypothetical protein